MTENEALRLSMLAQRLMPTSPDGQAGLLMKAILPFDVADAQAKIEACAMRSKFIDVPAIREGIRARVRGYTREEAIDKRRADRAREARDWKQKSEADHAAAQAFCRAQPEAELARMRAAVEGKLGVNYPWTVGALRGRETLKSVTLMAMIYDEFVVGVNA